MLSLTRDGPCVFGWLLLECSKSHSVVDKHANHHHYIHHYPNDVAFTNGGFPVADWWNSPGTVTVQRILAPT
jgi:hypothetical protein